MSNELKQEIQSDSALVDSKSFDINDQNILDYEDELDNNLVEKSKSKNAEIDEESDGEVKSENISDNELDDGEVPSPRFEKKNETSTDDVVKQEKEASEKEEEEDGEINDGEKTKKVFVPRVLCKYYQRGKCTWGRGCKFLHPGVNDTGNYSFLEFQDPNAKVFQQPASNVNDMSSNIAENKIDSVQTESAWERGLRHAKEMKEKALKRKETEGDLFADKKMNLSLKEFENEKENDERYVNVERVPTADDDQEDEDLNQFAKTWRMSNVSTDKSSNRLETNDDSRYQYSRSSTKTKTSTSPERYNNRQRADEWHDPWDRTRPGSKKSPKDNFNKRDRSTNYSSSDSEKSHSRSVSRSSYSSKSSYSYRSSSKSSRSNSRSPNRKLNKKKSPERSSRQAQRAVDSKKTSQVNKQADKTLKKPLPGRQISDFSLKKAGIDSDKNSKKNRKTKSRSNSSSSYDSSNYKSDDENESENDDDSKEDSFSDDDNDDGSKNKKKSSKTKLQASSKKQSTKQNLKRSAQDDKSGIDAKKHKSSTEKQAPTTDKKQMIKDQLKLLESALKKKTLAK